MTVPTENATPPKSTKSNDSDSSVSCGTHSNWDSGWARGGVGALAPQLPAGQVPTNAQEIPRVGPKKGGKFFGGPKSGGLSVQEFIYIPKSGI